MAGFGAGPRVMLRGLAVPIGGIVFGTGTLQRTVHGGSVRAHSLGTDADLRPDEHFELCPQSI